MPSQIEIGFAGERFVLDASGALWWPDRRLLVVSDLHLEKSTFLAAHGSLIPPYDTQDTLERLEQVVAHYRPEELILLGDSFHDRHAWDRLDDYLRRRIMAINSQVARVSWIEGNHDVALMSGEAVQFLSVREIEGLLFTHEHAAGVKHQIIGHFHPKQTVLVRNRHVRGPCFAVADHLLIMPAFGSYTGGLDIRHEVFRALAQGHTLQPYLLHRQQIYKIATEGNY